MLDCGRVKGGELVREVNGGMRSACCGVMYGGVSCDGEREVRVVSPMGMGGIVKDVMRGVASLGPRM